MTPAAKMHPRTIIAWQKFVKSGLLCPTKGRMKSSSINFNDKDTDTEAAALMKMQTNTRINCNL